MERHLHIISFDVPYPADYGGVIDVFFKIKALHHLGIRVHLHCFEYGRGEQLELKRYCYEVNYYHRNKGHKGFSHKLPYIVCSRSSDELTRCLLADDHPILLEGIHCTFLLRDDRFDKRRIVLRLHNVEYRYYWQLFKLERSISRKIYYYYESRLLRKYERSISGRTLILAISSGDAKVYREEFGSNNIDCLPVFCPFEKVQNDNKIGCFCLYHGNLEVAENEAVVVWLLKKVFNDLSVPFVIAGRNPSINLIKAARNNAHACLIANPTNEEMQDMVSKAQINIIPSFNCTGTKLKLLNALFNGKHCLVNELAVQGTPLKPICQISENAKSFKGAIDDLYNMPIQAREIDDREQILSDNFDNVKNAERLIKWIW
ncbi:MAG TPA: hypothetical protein VKR32_07080 [Puia sp.]|nr:hypothetical protein [Puia sp.]